MDRVVGQTKDVGFEIGVSRTVDHHRRRCGTT